MEDITRKKLRITSKGNKTMTDKIYKILLCIMKELQNIC